MCNMDVFSNLVLENLPNALKKVCAERLHVCAFIACRYMYTVHEKKPMKTSGDKAQHSSNNKQ